MDKPGQKLLLGGGYAAHCKQPKQALAVAGALAAGLLGLRVIGGLCARIRGRQGQRRVRREEQQRQQREGRRCRIIVDSTSPAAAPPPPLSSSSSSASAGVIHIHADCRGDSVAAACETPFRQVPGPAHTEQQGAAALPERPQAAGTRSQQRIDALEAQLKWDREARQERGKAGAEAARALQAATATESQLAAAMRQLSGLQSRITALTSEKKAADQGCKEAKAQLSSAHRQARVLQSAAEGLQTQLREATEGKAAAEAQLRSLLALQHKQQQGVASVHKVQAEAEMTREEMGEMRRALHMLQEELESARAARARSDAALAATQQQLRRLQAETKLYRETSAGRVRKRGA